jgi:diketogulonate reductase-like aldo/keto reductase
MAGTDRFALPVHDLRGVRVPAFIYGTAWKEERTRELTEQALAAGLVGIDTANQRKHYVEAAVGAATSSAIRAGRFERSGLFLQTKFTFARGQDHRLPYDPAAPVELQVEQSFASSLEHLETSYVDAYLLHGPSSGHGLVAADWAAWESMELLQQSGRARLIGISNVTFQQLELLCKSAAVKPAFVQNRCYARQGWDREVREVCRAHGVLYQGFSLLTANSRELQHPALLALARRRGRSPAQLAFRFAIQAGMLPLTGTSSPIHLSEDLECFDFELSEADMSLIESVGSLR